MCPVLPAKMYPVEVSEVILEFWIHDKAFEFNLLPNLFTETYIM